MKKWPRLSIDAQKKIGAAENAANRQLGDNVRPYTPGDPDWCRNTDNILESGYRAIDFICGYAENIFDVHAAEYDCEALTSSGVLRGRIVPLVRKLAARAWTGWLLSTAIFEPPHRGQPKPGDIEFRLPARAARILGTQRGLLSFGAVPADPQLDSGLAELQERYSQQIERVLESRAAHWEQEMQTTGDFNADGMDRRALIDSFISRVSEAGRKITRTDIWTVAGYSDRTEFERFQRRDQRTTQAAVSSFKRVLKMQPGEFLRDLEKKKSAK